MATKKEVPNLPVRLIGTANHGFAQYAQAEIKRLIPDAKFTPLEPGEVFFVRTELDAAAVQEILREQEPIFLRHIQPADQVMEIDRTTGDLEKWIQFVQESPLFKAGDKWAIQVRKLPNEKFAYTPYGVKEAMDPILIQTRDVEPVLRAGQADYVLSVYLTKEAAYYGVSKPGDNLSGWTGGSVRYQREEGQISRAKFKLLEAEERFGLDFASYENAVDIGAAPGGWTSLLLERGLTVTAVDPGRLDESLLDHPKLTFLQKNADAVHLAEDSFDLLLCDMSWSPRQMAKLVADLLPALKSGGTAIITVKLMHKKPFQTVREIMEVFGEELELRQAKQLFHNREELTLHLVSK